MPKLQHVIKLPKYAGYFCSFQVTAQSKQSQIGQKFAQSGHSGEESLLLFVVKQLDSVESMK
jgi:hypothetical protein